jgi:hypothetical protein
VGDLYNEESLKRALWLRISKVTDLPSPFKLNSPLILHTNVVFERGKKSMEKKIGGELVAASGYGRIFLKIS